MVEKFSSQDGVGGEEEGRVEKEMNSRKSVRWSAVPIAPVLVCVRCEGERGSGPKGANDLF